MGCEQALIRVGNRGAEEITRLQQTERATHIGVLNSIVLGGIPPLLQHSIMLSLLIDG